MPNNSTKTKITFKSVEEQVEHISRGTDEIIHLRELEEKLHTAIRENKPLRIKAGFDPTAPNLHLGHVVLLQKLKIFQELGHQVIFLIGDFTGMIGDPSGMSETRRPLTPDEVEENARTYQDQVFKVLDRQKTLVRRNSEWMNDLSAAQMIQLTGQYTLARILERDDFQKRFQSQRPISIHEFIYPLLQGYDSVVLEADIEMGGRDQKFNLLVGRELQRLIDADLQPVKVPTKPQVVLTLPLLEGTDAKADAEGVLTGRKMSKSYGNAIGLDEEPSEMFGKVMSISDDLMWRYYELLTEESLSEVKALHPKESKIKLAKLIVTRFHSSKAADLSADEFEKRHSQRKFLAKDKVNLEIKEEASIQISDKDKGEVTMPLLEALVKAELCESKGEARRLIQQGAVQIDGKKVHEQNFPLHQGKSYEVRVGKRRFAKISL